MCCPGVGGGVLWLLLWIFQENKIQSQIKRQYMESFDLRTEPSGEGWNTQEL
jgi:hypothetical protein